MARKASPARAGTDAAEMLPGVRIPIPHEKLSAFCRKWQITEFALFGSVLRDDFRPDSDVDVLVTFGPGEHWSILHIVEMQFELEEIFGRKVDLGERSAAEASRNYIRRKHILNSLRTIYAV